MHVRAVAFPEVTLKRRFSMINRFALVVAVAAGMCGSALPAGAEDVGVGVGPVGVTIGNDRDRDRDKTVIIKKDRDDGDREKTVIIKKDRDHDRD
jgi:hypothetical protein